MKKITFLMLAAMIFCSGTAYAFGSLPDGWFDGKPVTPPEDVPPVQPPPPDPVQTITIEYGTRNVFTNEVNFHFSKPISEYGSKFNLNTGGKKYTIGADGYKDGNIEVRNSQTTKKLVIIAGPAYATKGASVAYPSKDPLTKPEATPTPQPQPGLSQHFHHWNPAAVWNGVGLVLCPDSPKYNSCTFNGEAMTLHGAKDKGRWVWAQYSKNKGKGGIIICDGTKFEVKGGNEMQKGDCW